MGFAATSPVDDRAAAASRTAALHAEHGAALLRYCRSRLPSQEDAEDATQVVFMNAYRHLASGTEPLSDAAWLFTIADRVVLTRRRALARRARVEFPTDMAELGGPVQHQAEHRTDLLGLTDVLARIPTAQRQAILLHEWRGLTYRTIAAELGVSVGAVDTLIFRARRALWEELRGGTGRRIPGLVSLVAWLRRSAAAGGFAKAAAGAASVAVAVVGTADVFPTRIAAAGNPAHAALHGRSAVQLSQPRRMWSPVPARVRTRPSPIGAAHTAAAVQPGLSVPPATEAGAVPNSDSDADTAAVPVASSDVPLPAAASASIPAAEDVAEVPTGGTEPPSQPADAAVSRGLQGHAHADNAHREEASFKAAAPPGLESDDASPEAAQEHGGPPANRPDPPASPPDQVSPATPGTPAAAAAPGQSRAAYAGGRRPCDPGRS
jgi:RNA polymerase sigma-70 factor (ECF subfamily)